MTHEQILINGMLRVLAGTIVLRCKSRFFAWSIGDAQDDHMKQAFYLEYQALDLLCDDLAVRIGLIGGDVPGSYSVLAKLSSVKECTDAPSSQKILVLAQDHDQLIADCRFVTVLAHEHADTETEAVLLKCIDEHAHCAEKLRDLHPRFVRIN